MNMIPFLLGIKYPGQIDTPLKSADQSENKHK